MSYYPRRWHEEYNFNSHSRKGTDRSNSLYCQVRLWAAAIKLYLKYRRSLSGKEVKSGAARADKVHKGFCGRPPVPNTVDRPIIWETHNCWVIPPKYMRNRCYVCPFQRSWPLFIPVKFTNRRIGVLLTYNSFKLLYCISLSVNLV